jgi:spermidine/putrescine-binding protein
MTDDLVKRLLQLGEGAYVGAVSDDRKTAREAADRIKKLESALHQWDDLIVQQFTGSRAAMSDMHDAAQITAALLHGDAPWPEPRIKKLEAALREIAAGYETEWSTSTMDNMFDVAQILSERINIARKALEGKDD